MRTVLLACAFALTAAPAFAGAPVELKPALVADGGTVTLADLFDGAVGPAGTVVVARAAAPGLNTVLDAGRVQIAARGAGLDWANAQGLHRIVVASVAGSQAPVVAAGAERAATRPGRERQALAYGRNINAGEIIQAQDLVWSDQAIAPTGAPGDPDQVIGQQARRPLRVGAPVMGGDFAAPVVVHRDDIVSVAYESAGIRLVLQGKAMKDASTGESLPVLNPQSKKVIEAVAAGPGLAVVGPRAQRLRAAPFATASLR